jgi:hypothetical protein
MERATTIQQLPPSTGVSVGGNQPGAAFSTLIQTAEHDFLASAQLLAERARFLTGASGVAIAFNQDGRHIYRVSCGAPGREIGTPVNLASKAVRDCIESQKTCRSTAQASAKPSFTLAVPIVREQNITGLFELTAAHEFTDSGVQSITQLADMLITALEHREAATEAQDLLAVEPEPMPAIQKPAEPVAPPVLWHAENVPPGPSPYHESSPLPLTNISACKSCGFPVSAGRTLCLDCEERAPHPALVPKDEIFSQPSQESWISSHGYTLASLVVTALAAVIIYWLRVR